tara:strand:+ start:134 stop:331 length:198 start_codon:yes stop_codon:yes gene_type:complete
MEKKSIKFNNKLFSLITKKVIKNKKIDKNKTKLKKVFVSDEIHLCLGPDVIKNSSGIKKGAKTKL